MARKPALEWMRYVRIFAGAVLLAPLVGWNLNFALGVGTLTVGMVAGGLILADELGVLKKILK